MSLEQNATTLSGWLTVINHMKMDGMTYDSSTVAASFKTSLERYDIFSEVHSCMMQKSALKKLRHFSDAQDNHKRVLGLIKTKQCSFGKPVVSIRATKIAPLNDIIYFCQPFRYT